MSDGLHVVLGATGGIGGAVLDALVRRGLPARGVSRRAGPPRADGVELMRADMADPAQASAAVEGAAVVFHCAMPAYSRWAQEFPRLTRAVGEATARAGACLVVADNLYAAARDGRPLVEDGPVDRSGAKGATRAAMSDELFVAHRRGDLRVTFGCAADYYGPGPQGLHSIPGQALFRRAVEGKRPWWPARTDVPHALHYLPDIGEALVTLSGDDRSWGRRWHLPTAEPLIGRDYGETFGAALGRRRTPMRVPGWMLRAASILDAETGEARELLWQFDRPFCIDDSAYRTTFDGPQPLPHDHTLAATAAWWAINQGAQT